MKALCVLYGGRLAPEAFEKLPGEARHHNSVSMALEACGRFTGAAKTVFLGNEKDRAGLAISASETVYRSAWTKKIFLEELSRLSTGFDLIFFSWADCPLLDPKLASALAERHMRYSAEYSYADGWPYGFAPELLSPGTAAILLKILGDDDGPVERETLFDVIKKDINSFDIETEISPVDLRPYRLSMTADSKRNLLLVTRFLEAGFKSASEAETFITKKPELLRTLPAFYNIQISGACPQSCSLCPWPQYTDGQNMENGIIGSGFMPKAAFGKLMDKIAEFSGDAVIDLSLWGEPALHPDKLELIRMVLERPELSLILETSGIGWKNEELEIIAREASCAAPRKNHQAPVSWIVSLDAFDPGRYREIRGPGFAEARSCAKTLLSLFPHDAYVQAVRVKGFEDDIENFYRSWKGDELPKLASGKNQRWLDGSHIIIQKYDDFAGALPKLQASDLSPVKRRPCWHVLRDVNILLNGKVVSCREDLSALKGKGDRPVSGNVFEEDLKIIWERGDALYLEHCASEYKGICAGCDEYYTYNF